MHSFKLPLMCAVISTLVLASVSFKLEERSRNRVHRCQHWDGHLYNLGLVHTDDPCVDCQCTESSQFVICVHNMMHCPDLMNCENRLLVPHQCCPICADMEHKCLHNGEFVSVGEVPSDNPCDNCVCTEDEPSVVCHRKYCGIPHCAPGTHITYSEVKCCPFCA